MGFFKKNQFIISVSVLCILMGVITTLSLGNWIPVWRFVLLIGLAHIPYAFALHAVKRNAHPSQFWIIVIVAILVRAILLPSPPVLSDDIHRFIWDGKISGEGINPYAYPPSAQELKSLRDDNWSHINNRDLRTIYPPAAQALFAGAAFISPSILVFKIISFSADIALIVLIFLLAGGRPNESLHTQPKPIALQGALLYGLNPLVCVETCLSGHMLEPMALLLIMASIYLHRHSKNDISPKTVAASSCLALATGVKFAPILLLPSMGWKHKWFLTFTIAFIAVIFSFSFASGTHSIETLDTFTRRWETNPGLFALTKGTAHFITGALTGTNQASDLIHIPILDNLVTWTDGSILSMHKDGGFPIQKPATFTLGDISLTIAKLVSFIILLGVFIRTIKRQYNPLQTGLWIFGTLILVTPVLHPWYILWILPFAATNNTRWWFVFTAFLPLSYLPLDSWWQIGQWHGPTWVPWVEYASLPIAFLAFRYFNAIHKKNS